jgi:hypothetical protein
MAFTATTGCPCDRPNSRRNLTRTADEYGLSAAQALIRPARYRSKTQAAIGKLALPQRKKFRFVVDIKTRGTLYTAFGTPPAKS